MTGLPESKKSQHLKEGAGHYEIFAGKIGRQNLRPLVLNFIDAAEDLNQLPAKLRAKGANPKAVMANAHVVLG
ncbi:MAG: hypothetical protein QMB16_03475 [Paracoccaceae bacterium]